MHPTLRQMPPKEFYFSIQRVLSPSYDAFIAAVYPPGPLPITIRSYLVFNEENNHQIIINLFLNLINIYLRVFQCIVKLLIYLLNLLYDKTV